MITAVVFIIAGGYLAHRAGPVFDELKERRTVKQIRKEMIYK